MEQYEWLILAQILMQVFLGILMLVFLRKITKMKKQIDEIVKEVKGYITYITEETEEEVANSMNYGRNRQKENEKLAKINKDEEQTKLIQTVLGEYFP